MVLVILAVIWAAVLLPPFLQNRSENRPADSISTFRNQLHVLERRSMGSGPTVNRPRAARPVTAPVPQARAGSAPAARANFDRARLARLNAKKRRRDILVTLLAASGLTLVLGVLMAPVLMLHLTIDVLLVTYVALLIRQRKLAEERSMKVRYLSQSRPAAPVRATAPAQLVLRRAATN